MGRRPVAAEHPGGVVDLRTGEIRPHRPDDYMTKITAVGPGGDCPLLLASSTNHGGGPRTHAFLQRISGYSLTGITREHALFFGYGTGATARAHS